MLKVVGASWMKIRMSTWIIGIVLVLGIVVVIIGQMGQLEQDGNYSATAYWNDETGFEIKFWGQGLNTKDIPKGVAKVYFQPHIETTGWAVINLETQPDYPSWVQAYAAGMLEGSLSWQLIYWHWKNTVQNLCGNQEFFCNYVRTYLEANMASVKKLCENNADPYWHQVYLFYTQLEGMKQGFEHGVKRSRQTIEDLELVDFLWLNAFSDVVDLEYKFYDSKPFMESFNFSETKTSDAVESILMKRLRAFRSVDENSNQNRRDQESKEPGNANKRFLVSCSAMLGSSFVKFSPENGELFVAHNTGGPYVSMLRMIKTYHLRYHRSATDFKTIENKLTFSSYPGAIHSMDDFYVISNGDLYTKMIITGTPIAIFNKNLWKHVSPLEQVLSGVRTVVASRLSDNGSDWTAHLSKNNSGTGNKQWMIVDVKKFKKFSQFKMGDEESHRKSLADAKDVLWIAEQLPGHFVMADQTEILKKQTYCANYGLPFYENVTDLSGTTNMKEIFGDAFSNVNSPLAKIYRRDHHKVRSIADLMKLMRSNSYKKDPFSMGNPRCAIGARGDIPTELFYTLPVGVIDSKVFSTAKTFSGRNVTRNENHEDHEDHGNHEDRDADVQSLAKEKRHFLAVAGPAHSKPSSEKIDSTETEPVEKAEVTVPETEVDDDQLEEDVLRPFDWSKSLFNGFPHYGHPDAWNFEPIFLPL